ncbi:kin of IRRE-like protein 3 [Saccoglossus kowalevskii]|uniref:Kin of IRRE-like protein 1-like n=1 Tax=Saccoglossus kowalevskii TaxID=10224 RepID=A0ABM0M645_SACKO|nr:PREDICTED: kin of IRRE-like protein 1-like [Saccoglossus kowalevskii]
MLLWAVIIIMAASMLHTAADPVFLVEPSSHVAVVGEDATLECHLGNLKDYQVYWYIKLDKSETAFLIGPFKNRNTAYPNYGMFGNDTNGEYNLKVSDATLEDIGEYGCLITLPSSDNSTELRVAYLNVTMPRPPVNVEPICELEIDGDTEGDIVSITCTSKGGMPPAGLAWKRRGTTVSGTYATYEGMEEMYNAKNTYTWSLSPDDDQATYVCKESHVALDESRTCEIGPFSVKYRPVVTVSPRRYEAATGDDVVFECSAAANPEVTEPFVWTFNGSEVEVNDTSVMVSNDTQVSYLTVFNITGAYYGLEVSCFAVNDLGEGNETGVIVRKNEPSPPRDIDNVLVMIGVIAGITLFTVIITVMVMYFVSGGVSCACCCRRTAKTEERERMNQKKKKNRNQNMAMNRRDDLALDLQQFEGGANQTIEMNEVTIDYRPPDTPPPPDFEPPSPPPFVEGGYNNPAYEHIETRNGMNDLQHGTATPNKNIEFVNVSEEENKDSTSHRMKMARKKKREEMRKNKNNTSEHDTLRLSDDPDKWIL